MVDSNNKIRYIYAPNLLTASLVNIRENLSLSSITLTSLTGVTNGDFVVSFTDSLPSLDLLSLIDVNSNSIIIANGSVLSAITFNTSLNCINFNLTENILSQDSVDDIFTKIDNFGLTGGTIDISGGSNAIPSPGLIASLQDKDWTVKTN